MNGAGDFVTGRELCVRVIAGHEWRLIFTNQDSAFAAQGLCGERRGIEPDIHRGRVKLDEFRICDHRAGGIGHGQRIAARLWRIRGDPEQAARTACTQDRLWTGKGRNPPTPVFQDGAANSALGIL